MTTDMEKLDAVIHTRLLATLGETVAAKKAVYLSRADGKYHKAQANQSRQPALGLTLESGALDDQIRVQRVGPVTDAGWSWAAGKPVYLSPDTPGELTQTPPAVGRQFMGMASAADTIILLGTIDLDALPTTTTTTTTTTTSTTTTTT
jgi:hypothetical protein